MKTSGAASVYLQLLIIIQDLKRKSAFEGGRVSSQSLYFDLFTA